MERVWSSVGFQLFFGKQRILEDHQRLRRKISRVTYSINDSTGNILTVENEILSRWKEYQKNLLNEVKATTRDTQEMIRFAEEEVFTAAEVVTAIKGIKFG